MVESWSGHEVEATVADYLSMLAHELRGEAYSKTEHRRRLATVLRNRSDGAIERKHQNISAILLELGFPYISGYKPLRNYQKLLYEIVAGRLTAEQGLVQFVGQQVESPATMPALDDILEIVVPPPGRVLGRKGEQGRPYHSRRRGKRTDYFARESRNRFLGISGERLVIEFERARLESEGESKLAARIEHVSETRGDGLGFDVLSFDRDGKDRLIEVKTTRYAIETPFYVTGNELGVSQECFDQYHLYRVFEFGSSARLFTVAGALDKVCTLRPVEYLGTVP